MIYLASLSSVPLLIVNRYWALDTVHSPCFLLCLNCFVCTARSLSLSATVLDLRLLLLFEPEFCVRFLGKRTALDTEGNFESF